MYLIRLYLIALFSQFYLIFLSATNVGHQIHSNNDLREFEANLLKGSYSFKFDPHYLVESSCPEEASTPYGCLLLNHDRPDISLNKNYNSTNDLIEYLKSDRFQELRGNNIVSIALCFKSAPELCRTTLAAFQNWLYLVDDFHARVINEVKGIEVILDGDAKPIDCLVGRWLPWNSVWINTDIAVSDAKSSNSLDNDYYRFQVLNDPESIAQWTNLASPSINYYKFSNGTYPYQLWEPDAQSSFLQYVNIYKYGYSNPTGNEIELAEHPSGFNFAINIDVGMFQLYTGSATRKAINKIIVNDNLAYNPHIEYIEDSTRLFLHSYQLSNSLNQLYYSFISLSSQNYPSDVNTLSTFNKIDLPTSDIVTCMRLISNSRILYLFGNSNLLAIYLIDTQNQMISSIDYSFTSLQSELGEVLLDIDEIGDEGSNQFIILGVQSSESTNTQDLIASIVEITTIGLISSIKIIKQYTSGTFPLAASISDAKVLVLSSDSSQFFLITSIDSTIIGAHFSFDAEDNVVLIKSQWIQLSVGKTIDISNFGDVIMMVNSDGYCFNSEGHNTQAYPNTVCSTIPISTPYILDYSIGLENTWLSFFQSSSCIYGVSTNCNGITSCSNILHGSYEQGSSPSVALGVLEDGSIEFLETHIGVPTKVTNNNNGCGDPVHVDGLLLDSFSINQWIKNLRTFL